MKRKKKVRKRSRPQRPQQAQLPLKVQKLMFQGCPALACRIPHRIKAKDGIFHIAHPLLQIGEEGVLVPDTGMHAAIKLADASAEELQLIYDG